MSKACRRILGRNQEFDIPLRAGDGAWRHPQHAPAPPLQPVRRFGADALVDGRVADHSAFADLVAIRLELRLDQRNQPASRPGKCERRVEHLGERNEAGVADDQVDRLADDVGGQVAGVGLLVDDDAQVLAQLPGELVGADVDREHLHRPALEQYVGEAAGRGADVERHRARHVPAEMIERMSELDAAARDPGMVAAPDLERRLLGQRLAGFLDLALAREDQAGEDQRLRPRPTLGETAIHQQLIGAELGHEAILGAAPGQSKDRSSRRGFHQKNQRQGLTIDKARSQMIPARVWGRSFRAGSAAYPLSRRSLLFSQFRIRPTRRRLQPPTLTRCAQARASSITPVLLWRSALSTVSTMPSASSPASAYCLSGLSWSWKRSGRRMVRSFRPESIRPSSLAKVRTWAPRPPTAASSTVTQTSWVVASRRISASSSGLAKRRSATVVESPLPSSMSAALSASASRVPSERIATFLPSRTTRPLPISSRSGVSGSATPVPLPRG